MGARPSGSRRASSECARTWTLRAGGQRGRWVDEEAWGEILGGCLGQGSGRRWGGEEVEAGGGPGRVARIWIVQDPSWWMRSGAPQDRGQRVLGARAHRRGGELMT